MVVVGIDYSITSPGLCIAKKEKFSFKACQFHYLNKKDISARNIHHHEYPSYNLDIERYSLISDWVISQIGDLKDDCVVYLEGYAFSARGLVFNIGENGGMLKYKLWYNGIPFFITPPSTIKKFATGKGNASKEMMYESFLKETKCDLWDKSKKLNSPATDIIDSYFICKYGAVAELLKDSEN